jgi:hypothetical protein
MPSSLKLVESSKADWIAAVFCPCSDLSLYMSRAANHIPQLYYQPPDGG